MRCYLINAYVTHKAITPIRALGQLKFQWSSLPKGVHDKGLKIFSGHKQLSRAKEKQNNQPQPTASKQFSGLPRFMGGNVRVLLARVAPSVRCSPRGAGESRSHPLDSLGFPLFPLGAAESRGSCSRTEGSMAGATAGQLTTAFKSSAESEFCSQSPGAAQLCAQPASPGQADTTRIPVSARGTDAHAATEVKPSGRE